MKARYSFAAVLAVMALSIVFGMVIGGRLNAPQIAMAGGSGSAGLFASSPPAGPAATAPDFADIAERSIPAVVSVTNTSVRKADSGDSSDDDGQGTPDEQFFRFFFGPDGNESPQGRMRPQRPQRQVSGGSGFIVSKDGFIMTNNHVVENATKLDVTLDDGSKYQAEVVGTDAVLDLALIKIDPQGKDLPTLPLGDSDGLRVGEWVMAIGNPLEFERTVTVGVVSGVKRNVGIGSTIPGIANFIQTDAAINFGNSGGPLLDAHGRVVGINTAIVRGGGMLQSPMVEGIGFAVAINEARRAAEQLRDTGKVERGYLGITMNRSGVNEAARKYYGLPDAHGVIVDEVTETGPAAKAGVERGDVIRKVNGEEVRDNQDLLSKVASLRPGEVAALEVIRDGKTKEIRVTLANRPENPLAQAAPGGRARPGKGSDDDVDEAEGLGIKVARIPSSMRQRLQLDDSVRGVWVEDVDPESPAAEVDGLSHGGILTGVNDAPVRTPSDFAKLTKDIRPGEAVKLDLWRGTTTESVYVTAPKAGS